MDIKAIQQQIRLFAQEREWEKFHTPKNLSMAMTVEAGELMELFQWLNEADAKNIMGTDKAKNVKRELADVAVYLLRLCDVLDIDLTQAISEKMQENALKYPVDKSKGHARKYDEL